MRILWTPHVYRVQVDHRSDIVFSAPKPQTYNETKHLLFKVRFSKDNEMPEELKKLANIPKIIRNMDVLKNRISITTDGAPNMTGVVIIVI